MKAIFKAAFGVMGFGLVAACQPYDGYGGGYYAGGGYGAGYSDWGYCDDFGCPDNYWDQPLYYGSVYYGGRWNNGPFYYRNYNGGRQYWLGGGWRNDGWSGARPQQYRNDRYGPALGRDWYRNNRPNDGRPGFNQGGQGGGRGGDNRPGFNQGGRGDGDGNRGLRGGGRGPDNVQQNQQSYPDRGGRAQGISPQRQQQQQAAPQGPRGGGDGPRPGGRARGLPQQ
jgi:hypothetical protein